MTNSLIINDALPLTFILFSAITMALLYQPILEKLSVGLVSPYPKAHTTKRLFATMIDGTLLAIALGLYRDSGSLSYVIAGAAYLLLRDAILGRSVGKFVCGLMVINQATGGPGGFRSSVGRNVLLVLPGANIVAVFLESATIVRDPQGQRLGDRFALTQVVEGLGAKDFAAAAHKRLLDFITQFDGYSPNPDSEPVRVHR